jgi:hypothetical protein
MLDTGYSMLDKNLPSIPERAGQHQVISLAETMIIAETVLYVYYPETLNRGQKKAGISL